MFYPLVLSFNFIDPFLPTFNVRTSCLGIYWLDEFKHTQSYTKKAIRAVVNVSWMSRSLPLFEKYSITDVSDIYPQRLIVAYQAATRGKHETFF